MNAMKSDREECDEKLKITSERRPAFLILQAGAHLDYDLVWISYISMCYIQQVLKNQEINRNHVKPGSHKRRFGTIFSVASTF